jgi:hypothetical protein
VILNKKRHPEPETHHHERELHHPEQKNRHPEPETRHPELVSGSHYFKYRIQILK